MEGWQKQKLDFASDFFLSPKSTVLWDRCWVENNNDAGTDVWSLHRHLWPAHNHTSAAAATSNQSLLTATPPPLSSSPSTDLLPGAGDERRWGSGLNEKWQQYLPLSLPHSLTSFISQSLPSLLRCSPDSLNTEQPAGSSLCFREYANTACVYELTSESSALSTSVAFLAIVLVARGGWPQVYVLFCVYNCTQEAAHSKAVLN